MTPKIGRNEPCPCGSGKKYKKCCGRESLPRDLIIPEDQLTGTPMDEYFRLLPLLALHEERLARFEADGRELKKARTDYEKRYRPGAEDGLLDSHFMSWLYFDLRFGKSRRTLVERVIDEPQLKGLCEPGPTLLRHMAESYATFYEVIDVDPDTLLLEELGTGKSWRVFFYRELLDLTAEKGEVWYTRLLGPPDRSLSYTSPYVYVREARGRFKRGVDAHAKDFLKSPLSIGVPADRLFAESQKESALFWAEYIHVSKNAPAGMRAPAAFGPSGEFARLPDIVNTDGDDIVFTEMHFRVEDEAAVRRKLAGLKSFIHDQDEESWYWLKAPSRAFPDEPRAELGVFRFKNGRLVAETNSRQRASRLEAKLMTHFSGLLVLEKTLYRRMEDIPPPSPEEAEKMRREKEELNARPEVREALRKYRESFYFEKWPRQRIPALGNVTPLQAAKTEKGRRKLMDLLDSYDRIQDANPDAQPRIDFGKLRLMLGLPPARRSTGSGSTSLC